MHADRSDLGPWMDLLGAVIAQVRIDAIMLRRKGILDGNGRLTVEGVRRFPGLGAKGRNKAAGLQRRDEVEEIGRMIYRGGLDRLFERLGLPAIGQEVRRDIDRQVLNTKARPR